MLFAGELDGNMSLVLCAPADAGAAHVMTTAAVTP
jgi:hypothetical protein